MERVPPALPPDFVDAGSVLLARNRAPDAAAVARAVRESLEHLQPWMPWANAGAGTVEVQAARISQVELGWERGTDFVYLLRLPGSDSVVGIVGLHKRIGPGAIEIGYWTHVAHAGRGYMTAAAKAATDVAEALADIDRVEIHTDEANVRSAAIPQRLGYRLDRVDTRPPEAPAESGRLQIWIRP